MTVSDRQLLIKFAYDNDGRYCRFAESVDRAVLAHMLASAPACEEVSRLLCHADYIRSSELDQYVFHVKPSRGTVSLALTAQKMAMTIYE